MKGIILAAGYATRLYPLTLDKPKALLPINGKPMINFIVDQLNTIPDINEIFVVTNHKFATHFDKWSSTVENSVPIRVLDDGTTTEDDRRGAIGDIFFTIEQGNIDEDVIIIAGDNLFTFKLLDCYKFFLEKGKDCIVAKELDDIEMLKAFAVAKTDSNDKVIDLVEKPSVPPSNLAVYATYCYKKETIKLIKQYLDEGNKPDAPGYFVQWLYKQKDVYIYRMQGDCYDVGTPKSYEDVQKIFS